jgi:hypothetical protein
MIDSYTCQTKSVQLVTFLPSDERPYGRQSVFGWSSFVRTNFGHRLQFLHQEMGPRSNGQYPVITVYPLSQPGTDVMILKIFLPKKSAKKLAFLTQNKAKLCKILIITLVFEKNALFFSENCQKSQKIVIITSSYDEDHFFIMKPRSICQWFQNIFVLQRIFKRGNNSFQNWAKNSLPA